jgi:hypothetical protein
LNIDKSINDENINKNYVDNGQSSGKWRMEQEVELRKGATVTCPATIEFTEQGQVITAFEGKLFTSEYKFTERPWPRKCTIQFEATAFQGPNDKEPVSYLYTDISKFIYLCAYIYIHVYIYCLAKGVSEYMYLKNILIYIFR